MNKMLRRGIALLLMTVLVLSALPAQAAEAISNRFPKENGKNKEILIKRGESAVVMITKVNSGSGELTLTVRDPDKKNCVIQTESRKVKKGSETEWSISFDEELPLAKQNIRHYVMEIKTDGKKYTFSVYLTYDKKTDTILVEPGTWYPDNTACVQGLPLRDMKNPKTDKWYHVLPLDLSKPGTYEYPYIASNVYIIGKVTVTIGEDTLSVTYHNNYEAAGGNTKTLTEYMNVFHSLKDIRSVDPAKMGQGYSYGQEISIERDLGGDQNVLLFILNRVTYCDYVTGYKKLTRYWPNLKENKEYRMELEEILSNNAD